MRLKKREELEYIDEKIVAKYEIVQKVIFKIPKCFIAWAWCIWYCLESN